MACILYSHFSRQRCLPQWSLASILAVFSPLSSIATIATVVNSALNKSIKSHTSKVQSKPMFSTHEAWQCGCLCSQGCLTRRTWRFGRRFRMRTDGQTCPSVPFRRTSACKIFFTIFFSLWVTSVKLTCQT